ncbi:hypothetical protein NECAME_11023 [Necator americanus]|uniref:Chloride channel protein n=1 Tax=Necator americanus TaxID=51031 RepID=W2T607_NECAM|nr:hypothetical protein NECAME_11023 [Necator americanus]ETN77450.1 hypothetical protein NECAME_11023 [Necator americanus]
MGAYGQTRFPDDSFLPEELPLFAFIGLLCGLAGALFIKCHRSLVLRLKKSNFCKKFVVEKMRSFPAQVFTNTPDVPFKLHMDGAASFCGSVTHTISVAVIVFELTGQLMHILPVMIAVLIANIVCSYFQPSIYDSIILTKELPYLPELSHFSHEFHTIVAEQIMVTDVKVIWKGMTYYQMKTVIEENRRLRSFPVVLDQDSRILLGSVSRKVLSDLIEGKIGNRARQMNAIKRLRSTIFSPEYRNESSTSVEFHNDNELNKQLTSRRKASNQQPPKEEKLTRGMDSDCSKLLHCVGADGSCSECDRVVATACEVERGLRSNDCLVEERKSSLKSTLSAFPVFIRVPITTPLKLI